MRGRPEIKRSTAAENFFILTWMIDADKAAEKVASLKDEEGSLACIVDLSQEWHRT